MTVMWGIHNDALGAELFDQGFISIGWDEVGDLARIGPDQALMKTAVARAFPVGKPGAVPGWASIMVKFALTMQPGDRVVVPYKRTRTLNFGIVDGPYAFHAEVQQHQHRRRVHWVKTGVPRSLFPQAALFEIGSAITLFQVRRHTHVFGQYSTRHRTTPSPRRSPLNTPNPKRLQRGLRRSPMPTGSTRQHAISLKRRS